MKYKIFLNPKNSLKSSEEYYELMNETANNSVSDYVVFAPALLYQDVLQKCGSNNNKVSYGIQGIRLTAGGGTASVDPEIIHTIGGRYGMIGHSDERRSGMSVSDIKKSIEATPNDFTLLVCVGESSYSKEAMMTFFEELEEIEKSIVTKNFVTYVTYEPQWLISTNKNEESSISHDDTVTHCIQTIETIKSIMQTNRVLYGGSVADFSPEELKRFSVEGFLIGSLSTKPEALAEFISSINN